MNNWMWQSSVDEVVIGPRLGLNDLGGFSSLEDSGFQ